MSFGDLAEQCLRHLRSANGKLKRGHALDTTIATAILCDLFLAGRITGDAGGWVIDTAQTRHRPTDHLLRFIDDHPGIALDDVAEQVPSMTESIIDTLVAKGTWGRTRRGRFEDLQPASLHLALKDEPYHLVTRNQPASAFNSCLAVLLYPWRGMSDEVLAQCGPARDYLSGYIAAHGVERIGGIDLLGALFSGWQPT